jgi:anthranilate phosphoribosyltransferase
MTPRCFASWSKGKAEKAKRDADDRTALAFATAMFTRSTKRERLADYLIASRKRATTPADMLAMMREFQARGANMNFRQVH